MSASKSDSGKRADGAVPAWSVGVRRLVTALIVVHVVAVLAGALGARPSSDLEHHLADFFAPYHQVLDQGDSYRYYSSAFPPTPVVTATLSFTDGRPDRVVRIPDKSTSPRLLYQRQLAMAHYLMEDFEAAKRPDYLGHDSHDSAPDPGQSRSQWAHAFASYLGKTNPGCKSVTLRLETHLVPRLDRVQELLETSEFGRAVDLEADEFLMAPERIGVYPCDASSKD